MRAVIMAGGKGARLRPFTTVIPKPLVPIGDMAIMEVVVRQLAHSGFDHITVAVSHLAHLIIAYFGDGSRWGLKIDYSFENKPLSTIGPLKLIEDLPDHFLVMNGDVLTDLDFGAVYRHHVEHGNLGTVTTFERDVEIDFGVIRYDAGENHIAGFMEKPVEHFNVCMGVNVFAKGMLDFVPDDVAFGFDDLLLKLIAESERICAYPYKGYWLDIGRPDDYDRANGEFDGLRDRLLPQHPGEKA
jgi:NDP-sugar pyrophosphorylase family protein